MTRRIEFILFISILVFPIFGQDLTSWEKRSIIQSRIDSINHEFSDVYDYSHAMINGRLHHGQPYNSIHHPYFLYNEWVPGTILTQSNQYQDILIKYDLQSDNLLYMQYTLDGIYTIELLKSSISGFTIGEHTFIHFKPGRDEGSIAKEGYYEIIYDGETRLIKKWSKYYLKTEAYPYYKFDEQQTKYIERSGHLIKLSHRYNLMKLFPEKTQEIKLYIREQNIKIRSADEKEMVDLLKYADQLNSVGE